MKKFLSIILVLAIVLSLSMTAFATENTGSITITNATLGEDYAVYKIFDATISKNDSGETNAVSYSIDEDTQIFDDMFGEGGEGEKYFVYNPDTGSISKKEGVNDSDLIKYLTKLVKDGGYNAAAKAENVTTDEVKFENLSYGYYLITSSLGAAVTINSNTPDVSVIDKNQKPGNGFDKLIATAWDEDGNPTAWADANSANIGDKVTYKISFEATNYDGDKKIKYYQVHDEKGNAIWAEFNSFKVFINGEEIPRGYYLDHAHLDNGSWEFLNENSDHEDSWKNIPAEEKTRDNAQWYLVHLGEDQFRITIPWLEDHSLTENTGTDGNITYTLKVDESKDFCYTSPVTVEIYYDAVVEANAAIGNGTRGNRYNKANASWTMEHETGSTGTEEVVTYVYGLGLLKDDIATGENLAGAEFRIYSDAACTVPVNVIPTNIKGIYMVDSAGTPLENATGTGRAIPREIYAAQLEAYLKDKDGNTITNNNLVVSQENGKLAILGLEAGTYYLKEVKAPDGYNELVQSIELTAGENITPFSIFANANGDVADIQQANGTFTETKLDLTYTVVHNSKGVVLPSTGGTGTMMLITIGTVLAIGFAVFLITHKKMSIYVD